MSFYRLCKVHMCNLISATALHLQCYMTHYMGTSLALYLPPLLPLHSPVLGVFLEVHPSFPFLSLYHYSELTSILNGRSSYYMCPEWPSPTSPKQVERWKQCPDMMTATDLDARDLLIWLSSVTFNAPRGGRGNPLSWVEAVKTVVGLCWSNHDTSLNAILSQCARGKLSDIANTFHLMLALWVKVKYWVGSTTQTQHQKQKTKRE